MRRRTLGFAILASVVSVVTLVAFSATATPAAVGVGGRVGADLEPSVELLDVVKSAGAQAFQSGAGGFLAGACQVVAFMWLRTAMNYQYKHGGSLGATLRTLWADGGLPRLYKGLFPWALLQAPLSRFGDTASNALVLGVRSAAFPSVPVGFATAIGSICGATFRVVITPIDTCKTTLQTDGAKGWTLLKEKIRKSGITVLWYGWEGNYLANVVGGYPFFVVLNFLTEHMPLVTGKWEVLLRHAFIGAISATVSDITSNSIRVMKTKKQTSPDPNMGYIKAMTDIIASDGVFGFMFRGLDTRIFTNIMQGAFFTVLWRGIFKGA